MHFSVYRQVLPHQESLGNILNFEKWISTNKLDKIQSITVLKISKKYIWKTIQILIISIIYLFFEDIDFSGELKLFKNVLKFLKFKLLI